MKKCILTKAKELIEGPRAEAYGDFRDNFRDTADIVNTLRGTDLEGEDIAWVLIVLKMVRERAQHKTDNLIDICGYTKLLNDYLEAK
jgi:hypothetical protein